jgi:iron(III) transport system permease protein
MRQNTAWMIFGLVMLVYLLFFIIPLISVIKGGFFIDGNFTLVYLKGVFSNPIYREGLRNSLLIGVGTTLLATLIALPLAWVANRYNFPGKSLLTALLLVPMILPPFVGAIGFQQLFGQYGSLNAALDLGAVDWLANGRYFGVILLQALSLYPIMYLNVAAALANIDHAMLEAAENMGSSGFNTFRRITLPLIMPGIFAGGTIIFIWGFTELGTPLIMSFTRCASVQVFDALKEIGSNPFPYALVFVMLTASVALYLLSKYLFGQQSFAMTSKAATQFTEVEVKGVTGYCLMMPFLAVVFLALLPHFGVILTSFAEPGSWYRTVFPTLLTMDNYKEALGHGITVSSISNSLTYSLLAVLFNFVFGITIAFVVVRSDIKLKGVLDGLAMLPLAVPGLVMAFGYLTVSAYLSNLDVVKNSPVLLNLFDVRTNPTLFLVIAYSIRRLPYMVRSAVSGLQQTSVTLEEAAANVGATPMQTLWRITVPLIAANLIAGALLAFAFSMMEVSDGLMLAQREDYYPITKTIYELFQLIGTGVYVASALGVWAMLFLAVTIAGASVLMGKRMGALFRV